MNIILFKQGLFASFLTRQGINSEGEPSPWFTYPAIEFISQFDFSDKYIFEYGAGISSLFWSNRSKAVFSVESDRHWFESLSKNSPSNLYLFFEDDKLKYCSSIKYQGIKFDVVVVDGLWRNICAEVCTEYLSDDGIIIFDNTDRHYNACNKLQQLGFFQIDFNGLSPINSYASTTSIFIKARNFVQRGFLQPNPIGGLNIYVPNDD